MTYVTVPILLLPSPPSLLPSPANAPNDASPTSTSSKKPATPSSHVARQWQQAYSLGSRGGPFVALISCASYLYAARKLLPAARLPRRLFLAAAALSVAIVPFTFGFMKRTNDELHRRANAATSGDDGEANSEAREGAVESYNIHDLVVWWSRLNVMRAMLPAGAIGCAVAALNL